MAALKGLGAKPITTKEEFVSNKSARVLPAPRKDRVKSGDDPGAYSINIGLFGPPASGKTYAAEGLIRHGLKVLFVLTDMGDNGTIAVKMALKRKGLSHLSANYKMISIKTWDEMQDFMAEPASFFPDIYEWNPDFIYFDGFSFFQQTEIMVKVGSMLQESSDINIEKGSREKAMAEIRASGMKFEQSDYGPVRQMTIRTVDSFCALHNKVTGQLWHKMFSFAEAVKSKDAKEGGGFRESAEPLLTGAGGVFTRHAFDLIIRTIQRGDEFKYDIRVGETAATKNRCFSLDPVMDADFYKVWQIICDDLDIVRGATNSAVVAPILLASDEPEAEAEVANV